MIGSIQQKYSKKNDLKLSQNPHVSFQGNLAITATEAISKGVKKIETGGVLVDFCVVDMLGMVLPRTFQAFTRNREELNGKLNIQNGVEELIREIFSGPSMFVIPMAFIQLSKKCFGSASNIQFKTFESLTESFKQSLGTGKTQTIQLKESFYRTILNEIFEEHKKIGPQSSINIDKKIDQMIKNLVKIEVYKNPTSHISEIKEIVSNLNKEHSFHLDNSQNITLKSGLKKEIKELIPDLTNYSKDIVEKISKNSQGTNKEPAYKLLDKLSKAKIHARRFILASTILTTTAFLYSIPHLYKRNKQFPGINGLVSQDKNKSTIINNDNTIKSFENKPTSTHSDNVFKPFEDTINIVHNKTKNKQSISFGHSLSTDGIFKKFDFNGHSTPYPILAFYTLGLMLGCRYFQARNKDEKREVLTRDFSGLSTIVFAIPVLRNITSTIGRKMSGFTIAKPFSSLKEHLNPYNKPLSFENINDIYSGISKYKNNIVDFSENIANHGGDLRKILNFLSNDSKQALNEISTKLSSNNKKVTEGTLIKFLTKPFKNSTSDLILPKTNQEIIDLFKKAQKTTKYKLLLEKVIKEVNKPNNSLVKFAETIKSIPEASSIIGISVFLGWFLPWFNINYTKKCYK